MCFLVSPECSAHVSEWCDGSLLWKFFYEEFSLLRKIFLVFSLKLFFFEKIFRKVPIHFILWFIRILYSENLKDKIIASVTDLHLSCEFVINKKWGYALKKHSKKKFFNVWKMQIIFPFFALGEHQNGDLLQNENLWICEDKIFLNCVK